MLRSYQILYLISIVFKLNSPLKIILMKLSIMLVVSTPLPNLLLKLKWTISVLFRAFILNALKTGPPLFFQLPLTVNLHFLVCTLFLIQLNPSLIKSAVFRTLLHRAKCYCNYDFLLNNEIINIFYGLKNNDYPTAGLNAFLRSVSSFSHWLSSNQKVSTSKQEGY